MLQAAVTLSPVTYTDRAERLFAANNDDLARAVTVAATSRSPTARKQANLAIAEALRERDIIVRSGAADAVFGSRSEIDYDDLEATLADLDRP